MNKSLHFTMKTVSEKKVTKILKSMKKEERRTRWTEPRMFIAREECSCCTPKSNNSISSGVFPNNWREATVTPILKKGATTDTSNFRPVK